MSESDELATVQTQLAAQEADLRAELFRVLRNSLFSNRGQVRPASLKRIASAETRAMLDFLASPDEDQAHQRGAQLCQAGLGEEAVLGLGQASRRFCLVHLPKDASLPAIEALESYHSAVVRGFLQAHQVVMLEEQEHIRAALQRALGRATAQLEVAADIGRAATSTLDLDELLNTSVELIRERFGLYYVGLFLVDDHVHWAILRAGSGPAGQEMLRQGYKLAIGGNSMIGQCVAEGQPRLGRDVGAETVRFDNPLLPETCSELALPLSSRGRIIGAMTIQSRRVDAFSEQDVAALRVLVGQLANAIENSRLFANAQASLREAQAAQQFYLQEAWARGSASPPAYLYEPSRDALMPMQNLWRPEMEQAAQEGQLVVTTPDDGPDTGAALAAPITLRGQVIGMLDFVDPDRPQGWTEDDVALVQAISDQIALAAENARLFADTQRRAEQMTTLNRIGLDLAAGLELDSVLETLYEQCQQVLVTDTFYVALYNEESGLIEFPLLTGKDGPLDTPPLDPRTPSLTGHVLNSGQLLHVRDAANIPEEAPYAALPISNLPNRSYIGVPLTARGRTIGILSIQSYEPNIYSDEDIELLTTIASQASIAIENARAYQRLVETAKELREVDRLKTQFLANMSHELRTPLNSIIGFSRVMIKGIDGPLTDLQETDLTSIYSSGQHLLGLINSILDMSKIEAGKMDLSFDQVDLSDIFNTVVSTARGLLKDRPIELRTDFPQELPLVWTDTQRVRQILINLVSNAAKFTEKGRITITASADPEFVTISVSDTGIGIEQEAINRLFIAFQQVDQSTSRRAGGTGLGLAISRSFVELLGGEIWVESEPGAGSTFSFTLPVYEAVRAREEGQKEADDTLDPDNKTVLVIDDDEGVITLLKRYLENDGYQVIGVEQSHTAVETAQRLAPGLAAITLDVVMPNMDGWQVLRALKQNPQTQNIPVILCSIVEGLDQGLEMGAAACLRKPVTRDQVLEALKKVERRATNTDTD